MISVMARYYMPIEFERKVFTAGGSLRINLPSPITSTLKIQEGDSLVIWLNDSQIVMEKAKKGRS
jgi:bifunctional DNA-binding transcriptional regulator/antitoxin component of YhaV-PrlF toxin-antitoxin module